MSNKFNPEAAKKIRPSKFQFTRSKVIKPENYCVGKRNHKTVILPSSRNRKIIKRNLKTE